MKRGFSLIELVIAVALASFVFIGVATIAGQMVRSQMEGIRSGTVTGWSLVSYMAMAKEIEDANVLAYPIANGAAADAVVVCKNWSRMMGAPPGGKLNNNTTPAGANFVSVVQYCVDSSVPSDLVLRRFENLGAAVACPNPGVPVGCTAAPSGTWTATGVVGFRLEKLAGFPSMFTRDNAVGGVRIRYAIGRQTATTNEPVPKFTPFNIAVSMQRQYTSTLD